MTRPEPHNCPSCGRFVRWALTFCASCRWAGGGIVTVAVMFEPHGNPPWDLYSGERRRAMRRRAALREMKT